MKRMGRVTLFRMKKDRFEKIERLRVVVNKKDEAAARVKYKAMGYEVM